VILVALETKIGLKLGVVFWQVKVDLPIKPGGFWGMYPGD